MKKLLLILMALALCLSAAGCGSAGQQTGASQQASELHKIGVIVYNQADDEVVGAQNYLQGYIEKNFEMVRFLYSGSIRTQEQEMDFIQRACDAGVEGFMSFRTFDLAAEVALCEKNGAYYMLASGTVDDDAFAAVENNPYFLGMFGPGMEAEYQIGVEMAQHFIDKHPSKNICVLSGGAALGNEMHRQRTLGILTTLLPGNAGDPEKLAASESVATASAGDVTVTVCPGYIANDSTAFSAARDTLSAGGFDAVLTVLPPVDLVKYVGSAELGVVDSFNERNFRLFAERKMHYLAGKYSSEVGPAFALMFNAVTGYAGDFRDNGKAIKVLQPMWVAAGAEEYNARYALSNSETINAYNFDDLAQVCRLFNPKATLADLIALAEASSYEDVVARRG